MENIYITIGRQYGSGGREIGRKVAQALGIDYYDKELLAVAVKESGLSHQFLQNYDEKPTNSFLYSLVMGQQNMLAGVHGSTVEQMASKAQRDAVLSVAEKGSCVIVGRCADYILRDQPGLIRLFFVADNDWRIKYIMARGEGADEKEAEAILKKMDKSRSSYYSFHTDRKWGGAEWNDLCLNTSKLGIDGSVELILKFVQSWKQ